MDAMQRSENGVPPGIKNQNSASFIVLFLRLSIVLSIDGRVSLEQGTVTWKESSVEETGRLNRRKCSTIVNLMLVRKDHYTINMSVSKRG
jgi:hypothetical protein